ncbi:MAG: 3-dehydroquinate synthase [Myxococcota bacterium]
MRVDVGGYAVTLADSFAGLDVPGEPGRCVLVSNPVVGPLYRAEVEAELRASGWDPVHVEVPDGEVHKTLATYVALVDAILDVRPDRRTPVLALGGGVTGDLVGFAAATALRGLPVVQLPTTLLAMVDSSVGGKTGVNTRHGKNLVGAFHPPVAVWAALHALRTLDDAELRCGLGEVVKHAVIAGPDALARCEALAPRLLARDPEALRAVVADSVATKARVVAADPFEQGQRAVLNLGHTLGHAIEAVAGYGALRHGEAVAIGLAAMARFATARGWCEDPGLADRIAGLLVALRLPVRPPGNLDRHALEAAVGFDKKRARGKVKVAVPRLEGHIELRSLPLDEVPSLVQTLYTAAEIP